MSKRLLAALSAAAFVVLAFAPAAANASGVRVTNISFDTASSTVQVVDPEVTSELTNEFRSRKPNAQQELEAYLKSPKPAKHITRASDLRTDSATSVLRPRPFRTR
jgi:hypothetical protein